MPGNVLRPLPAARILLVALVCALAVAAAQAAPARAGLTRPEARLLHAMNHARAVRGLRRLHVGSRLERNAHGWARYLLRYDAFYHGRITLGTSENIGWLTCRRGWAYALVRMWLNSPAHRVHLLDPSARRIGVGVASGSWSGYGCVRMAVTRFR
jgi:uncharacterized protein YkwD